jgi:hypothetical protein
MDCSSKIDCVGWADCVSFIGNFIALQMKKNQANLLIIKNQGTIGSVP